MLRQVTLKAAKDAKEYVAARCSATSTKSSSGSFATRHELRVRGSGRSIERVGRRVEIDLELKRTRAIHDCEQEGVENGRPYQEQLLSESGIGAAGPRCCREDVTSKVEVGERYTPVCADSARVSMHNVVQLDQVMSNSLSNTIRNSRAFRATVIGGKWRKTQNAYLHWLPYAMCNLARLLGVRATPQCANMAVAPTHGHESPL